MKGRAGPGAAGEARRPPWRRQRFGQHFLVDGGALRDIADLVSPEPGDLVLEVGPGRGALTAPLLERLGRLTAVEIDRDLAAFLRRRFDPQALRLIEGDVLDLDLAALVAADGLQALFAVGNLPYNITAPVLFRLRSQAGLVRRAVLTLQKEVAERLVAPAGTRTYSQLTVLLGQCATVAICRQIPRTAFRPSPKVDSAVVDLRFAPGRVPVVDLRTFEVVVKAAFAHRRKMLRNALQALPHGRNGGPIPAAVLEGLAERATVDLSQRAEDLSVEQYAGLTRELMALAESAR